MLNNNAKKWVAALRSGEYEKGVGVLNGNNRFCCLGVACDLALKSGVEIEVKIDRDGDTSYDGKTCALPKSVRDWISIESDLGRFESESLASLNDSGKTFAQIADIIESEPERLFI